MRGLVLAAAVFVIEVLVVGCDAGSAGAPAASAATHSPCANAPTARLGAIGAFDTADGASVLFGGDVASPPSMASSNETWIGRDGCWLRQQLSPSPPARAYGAMDYVPKSRQLVLFGGQRDLAGSSPVYLNDLWSWNGASWTILSQAGPSLDSAVGAYDVARDQLVVLGTPASGPPAQTWIWKAGAWSQLRSIGSPTPRVDASISYDHRTQQVVLFGGFNDGLGHLGDTWAWDGAGWTQLRPPHAPSPRFGAAMCRASNSLVLFGGDTGQSDTWIWTGTDWSQVRAAGGPTARRDATCTAQANGQVILFGGQTNTGQVLNDVWTWNGSRWASAA